MGAKFGCKMAATFCSQPHKQASAQSHNDSSSQAAGCEAKVVAEFVFIPITPNLRIPQTSTQW